MDENSASRRPAVPGGRRGSEDVHMADVAVFHRAKTFKCFRNKQFVMMTIPAPPSSIISSVDPYSFFWASAERRPALIVGCI